MIKIIFNIIFFAIYALISMNLVNFIFDIILNMLGKPVPASNDVVHLKIAGLTFVFVLLISMLYRKYFYLTLKKDK